MATIVFNRNYNASDMTAVSENVNTSYFNYMYPCPSIEDYNWVAEDGKFFVEWNTEQDGSGASFLPGDYVYILTYDTFYAIWADDIDYLTKTSELTSIANAIRRKANISSTLTYPEDFVMAINSISTYTPLDSYPIGSIYMSTEDTSPDTLFGGTWERITGRFLLGATDNGSSGASQAAGRTGGEATHTLTENEMPAHTHPIPYTTYNTSTSGTSRRFAAYSGSTVSTGSAGSGAAHNNMPPYLSVYMWKRTA